MTESSRRWVVFVACVTAAVCAGFGYTWSVYIRPMAAAHGWPSADVALSYTALMSTAAVMPLVSGWALRYVSPRTLLLAGGVLLGAGVVGLGSVGSLGAMYAFAFVAGVGLGITYPGATMANLIRWFPDRGGFASGWLTGGAGIGGMLWGPVAVWLIGQHGLTTTLRVIGACFILAVAVCSRFVATAPREYAPDGWSPPAASPATRGREGGPAWRGMVRSPLFLLLMGLFLVGTTSGTLVISQASPIVENTLGASARAAGAAVTILAAGMVLGKVGWGWLSDRLGRYLVVVLLFAVALAALLLMITASAYAPLVLGMALVAMCYGGFVSVMGPVTADAFGERHLNVNFGIMFLSIAVAGYVGPQLGASAAAAKGGDYTVAFVVAAVLSAVALPVAAACWLGMRRRPAARLGTGPAREPEAD